MATKFHFEHSKEVRIYSLKDLAVPPRNYARFLTEVAGKLQQFVIEENHCSSLEEVAKKYARALEKANPGMPREELLDYIDKPLVLWVKGKLEYYKSPSRARQAGMSYRSGEYVQTLRFLGRNARLSLEIRRNPKSSSSKPVAPNPGIARELPARINAAVSSLRRQLDENFPGRQGKMPYYKLSNRRKEPRPANPNNPLQHHLSGFSAGMGFCSIPTSYLEGSVQVIVYGVVSGGRLPEPCFMPAIRVEAGLMNSGSRSLPNRVVDILERVVQEHYPTSAVEITSSYRKRFR